MIAAMRVLPIALVLPLLAGAGCVCQEPAFPEVVPSTQAGPEAAAGRISTTLTAPPAPGAPPPCTPRPPIAASAEGGVADVLVHLPSAPGQPPSSLELSGDGCRFSPPAAHLAVGGELVVANDGEGLQTFHIHRLDGSHERTEQNLALPPGADLLRWRFPQAGRYRITADLRPWMEAFVHVVEGGTTARSDGEGRFTLDLPPGDWDAELWHPALGRRSESLHVPADGPGSLYLTWSEPGEDARMPPPPVD